MRRGTLFWYQENKDCVEIYLSERAITETPKNRRDCSLLFDLRGNSTISYSLIFFIEL